MGIQHIPAPLTEGHLCSACKGTGADIEKTMKLTSSDSGYVRCWTCNGNGLDSAEYFRWGSPRKLEAIT
jgi:DnaJ-class molecular chaperone